MTIMITLLLSNMFLLKNENVNFNMYLYPIGCEDSAYNISYDNSELTCSFGEIIIENYKVIKFLEKQSKIIHLEKTEDFSLKQNIVDISELQEVHINYIKKGGWIIHLILDDKRFDFYYGDNINPLLHNFVNKILLKFEITIDSLS